MAAPSGIIWGSIIGDYGRIGIYISISNTNTTTAVSAEVWFWSKYSVIDANNTLYFDFGASNAITDKGSASISTASNSGGWSTSNQIKIGTYSTSYARGTSASVKNCAAKLEYIDRVGGTMTVSTSFTVPAKSSYKIAYNANGGSGAPSTQTKWYGTDITLSSTKPTRTGYSFAGWATSSTGSVVYAAGATYAANASVTLYAKWTANTYTVSYNANGGSGTPGNQTKTYGVNLTLSSTRPTKLNYTFAGWGTSSGATTVAYAPGGKYSVDADITLYAIWALSYTKPRIKNVTVARCNSSGTEDEFGTYALIKFDWETDKTVSAVTIAYLSTSTAVSASGTSGSVSKVIGGGNFGTDYSYALDITVKDSNGQFSVPITLPSTKFIMDIYKEGYGVAIGGAALNNVFQVYFASYFKESVIGYKGFMTTNPNKDLTHHFHATSGQCSTNTAFHATRTDKTTDVFFGIGSGGVNHGIYSDVFGGWLINFDGSNANINAGSGFVKVNNGLWNTNSDFYMGKGHYFTTVWSDNGFHGLIAMHSDGLSAYFGPEDLGLDTKTYIRGKTVRLCAHSGGAVYLGASGSTAVTSDKNLKTDIFALNDKYADFFEKLVAVSYKYDAENIKGHRDHIGFIAQDVEKALLGSGLTTEEFAGICIEYDVSIDENHKKPKREFLDEDNGAIIEEAIDESEETATHYDKLYSLRYEEFIALNTHMIQRANKIISEQQLEIETLKVKLKEQEDRLANIEKLLGV